MATYINSGDIIEGGSIICHVRWSDKRGLKKHPITQEALYLYVTDRNSEAEIIKTIDPPDDFELRTKTQHFHRELGDKLKADSLSIFVKKFNAIRIQVKEGISARHGAQILNIPYKTIAEIKTPLFIYNKAINKTATFEQKVIDKD